MSYLDITSASATMIIQMDKVIPNPTEVDHFATDAIAKIDEVTFAEHRMGVDGYLAVGYVPSPISLTIQLEAGSKAQALLANAYLTFKNNKTTYKTTLTLTVPSLRKRYVYSNGTMISGNAQENLGKVLEATSWKFVFESYAVSEI